MNASMRRGYDTSYPFPHKKAEARYVSDEEMKDFLRMRLQPKSSYELPPVERRKLLRQAFGLSQRELGEQIGVSDASISTWESGKSTPRGEARKRYIAFCRAAEEVLTELEQKEGGANDDESSEEEG